MVASPRQLPSVVYGPWSTRYDFGGWHPLTPRRFGPGMELLRALGADRELPPEPATDDELERVHAPEYVRIVRRFSVDTGSPPAAGIGPGDDPPFAGMHEAAAAVAGGSLAAMEAILAGREAHAFHPGGGLHHAMPARASGFCVYNDVALAIARARAAGLRVLYVDLDVHHGDGVQAIFWDDPGVLTVSLHESGRHLFPGTGFVEEIGGAVAAGTKVNVPLEPGTADRDWLAAFERLVPVLAAVHAPDVLVTQHGSDSHAWDPLANLALSTRAMERAARRLDTLSHRYAAGRWLATGGGGYDAYRVVSRAWGLVWSAQAHRSVPERTPVAWRTRWADEARRYGQAPLPPNYLDGEEVAETSPPGVAGRDAATLAQALRASVPALLRGWEAEAARGIPAEGPLPSADLPVTIGRVGDALPAGLRLGRGVTPVGDAADAIGAVSVALREGGRATLAIADGVIVGLVLIGRPRQLVDPADPWLLRPRVEELVTVGVAAPWRRHGLAARLLREALDEPALADRLVVGMATTAERDPFEPASLPERLGAARRLLAGAGFVETAPQPGAVTPPGGAVTAVWSGPRVDPADRESPSRRPIPPG